MYCTCTYGEKGAQSWKGEVNNSLCVHFRYVKCEYVCYKDPGYNDIYFIVIRSPRNRLLPGNERVESLPIKIKLHAPTVHMYENLNVSRGVLLTNQHMRLSTQRRRTSFGSQPTLSPKQQKIPSRIIKSGCNPYISTLAATSSCSTNHKVCEQESLDWT